jgi:hypothetical protein
LVNPPLNPLVNHQLRTCAAHHPRYQPPLWSLWSACLQMNCEDQSRRTRRGPVASRVTYVAYNMHSRRLQMHAGSSRARALSRVHPAEHIIPTIAFACKGMLLASQWLRGTTCSAQLGEGPKYFCALLKRSCPVMLHCHAWR